MALYTMGDLHLSFSPELDKPMGVFGDNWENHETKIRENWCLSDDDTIVLTGDLSWAMTFDQLRYDLDFIDSLPGTKILLKGNHDYWWSTMKKLRELADEYKTVKFLHNNSYLVDGLAICGTRGWIAEPDQAPDELVLRREAGRLRMSLDSAKEGLKTVFLHYPPIYADVRCDEIMEILLEYGIKSCYYGHLHGKSHRLAENSEREGISFRLVAGDYLDFKPLRIT